jgi:hypothetical protein
VAARNLIFYSEEWKGLIKIQSSKGSKIRIIQAVFRKNYVENKENQEEKEAYKQMKILDY